MPPTRRLIQALAVGSGIGSLLIYSRPCRVHGWAVKETTGAAVAAVSFHDGSTSVATASVPITLAANESTRDWLGESGVMFADGLFVESVAGAWAGSVWVSELASDVYAEFGIPDEYAGS